MPYKDKAQQSAYQAQWAKDRRAAWIAANGPCKRCGSTFDLEVDHCDPDQKISHRVWSWSLSRREAELAKCQVLCKRCHKSKSDLELRKPILHGTRIAYSYRGCRCTPCVTAGTAYVRKRRKSKEL